MLLDVYRDTSGQRKIKKYRQHSNKFPDTCFKKKFSDIIFKEIIKNIDLSFGQDCYKKD